MKRYLITTADERSWKPDLPVIFLGEWCRRYNRRSVWSKMDAIVAAPYGLDPETKQRDLRYVRSVSEILLVEICSCLNRVHGTSHSSRYWNILLGHWLQRFVEVAYNRYQVIAAVLEKHELSGTTVLQPNWSALATADTESFNWACNEDLWNHIIYSRILAYLGGVPIDYLSLPPETAESVGVPASRPKPTLKQRLKSSVRRALAATLAAAQSNSDAVIVNSYLPPRSEALLQLSLGQVPQLGKLRSFEKAEADRNLRTNLLLPSNRVRHFEDFIRRQIFDVIPSCYLEGYKNLLAATTALGWPERPKFIYTSNSFDTDELFKSWTALKVSSGVPYFTGQHGNNYGTLPAAADWPECVTCDRFITWGWRSEDSRTTPAFIFKTVGRKPRKVDVKGGLLLMAEPSQHRLGPDDIYALYGISQEFQFRFAEALSSEVRKCLTIRLPPSNGLFRWYDRERWKDNNPEIRIASGAENLKKALANSRVVVHSYDSSGVLETLSLNIPTLCFWYGDLNHLLPVAKPHYEQLKSAGIIASTPEDAAKLICDNWGDIWGWWNSETVQKARKSFCALYARAEKRPVTKMKKILQACVEEGSPNILREATQSHV